MSLIAKNTFLHVAEDRIADYRRCKSADGGRRSEGQARAAEMAALRPLAKARAGPLARDDVASSKSGRHDRAEQVVWDHSAVLIHNIPRTYTVQDLASELESLGLGGIFDFLHIPPHRLGHAFVNFYDCTGAELCMEVLRGHRFRNQQAAMEQVACVSQARIQGLKLGKMTAESQESETVPVRVENIDVEEHAMNRNAQRQYMDSNDDSSALQGELEDFDVQNNQACTQPSLGSRGHPFSCGAACKFASKRRGCKDGVNCMRCHLCFFTKAGERFRKQQGGDDLLLRD
mmetsp:Transcript_87048/g.186574  ORF Transcript_87048/g.186574 Transcript_87048/m.186574 type:complete len:288 (+) Transcript_87048:37-900(+)